MKLFNQKEAEQQAANMLELMGGKGTTKIRQVHGALHYIASATVGSVTLTAWTSDRYRARLVMPKTWSGAISEHIYEERGETASQAMLNLKETIQPQHDALAAALKILG